MSNTDLISSLITRIKLRRDTVENWISSQSTDSGKGNLAYGEIGLKLSKTENDTDSEINEVTGYIGIYESPTPIDQCPVIFYGKINLNEILNDDEYIHNISFPVSYTKPENVELNDNSVITWNTSEESWNIDNRSILLDQEPNETGYVFYDSSQEKFKIGEIILTDIDGGSYGGTDE